MFSIRVPRKRHRLPLQTPMRASGSPTTTLTPWPTLLPMSRTWVSRASSPLTRVRPGRACPGALDQEHLLPRASAYDINAGMDTLVDGTFTYTYMRYLAALLGR